VHPAEQTPGPTAAIDELQASRVDNDRLLAASATSSSRAQRGHSLAVAFSGTQIHAGHGNAFPLQQQGGDPTQQLVRQFSPKHYAGPRTCLVPDGKPCPGTASTAPILSALCPRDAVGGAISAPAHAVSDPVAGTPAR
jgi:hypothetical protein